jgi:hypothetical protein
MTSTVVDDLNEWARTVGIVTGKLGKFSACPFARNANFITEVTDGTQLTIPDTDFELIIFVLPANLSEDELNAVADSYNAARADLIFLPDHKDRNTYINTVQTNNGKHNLLLCQYRVRLNAAREQLANTDYYSYWEQTYLKEILSA